MSKRQLSIAMCTYNGSKYLMAQLESIATQSRLPDELIICDDCSNDDTKNILKAFASMVSFPVRMYFNEENRGSTKNFEKAISLCEGEIIVLSDQDDVWHPEKLSRIEAVFIEHPHVGLVFSDGKVVDDELRTLGYSLWQAIGFSKSEQECVKSGRAIEVLLKHNVVTGATMAFRTKFKNLFLPIPTFWVHDGWIALLISAITDLALINEPLIKYRQHSNQQIGVLKKGVFSQLAIAKKTKPLNYIAEINQYTAVYERLLAFLNLLNNNKVIALIEEKIYHLNVRASIPKQKIYRLPVLLKELFTLRYHSYSKGWKSFVKDFLL